VGGGGKMKRIILFIITLSLILSYHNLAFADEVFSPSGSRIEEDTDGWVHSKYSNFLNILFDDHYHLIVDEEKIEELELEGKDITVEINKENYRDSNMHDIILSTRIPTSGDPVFGKVYGFYGELPPEDFTEDYEWTDTFEFMGESVDITYTKKHLFQSYHKIFSYPLNDELLKNNVSYFPCVPLVHETKFIDYKIKITDNGTGDIILDGYLTDIARLNTAEIEEQYINYVNNGVIPDAILLPTYGTVSLNKEPNFVFTKWHKHDDGTSCKMDLDFTWTAERETELKDNFFHDIRYQDIGYELYPLHPENPYNIVGEELSVLGENVIYRNVGSSYSQYQVEFEHAGTEDSLFYAQLITKEGNILDVIATSPINGFFGIQISTPIGGVDKIFKKSAKSNGGISFDDHNTYINLP